MLTEELKPYLTKTKSGESAIGLTPEGYYLEVKRTMTSWSFRIQSFNQQNKYNTTWVKVDNPYKLETSRTAKKIRRNLGMIYPGRETHATEQVIAQLELYEIYWEPEIEDLKPSEPSVSDKLVGLVLDCGVLLFCDQHDDPHVQIPIEIMLNKVENSESVTGVTGVTSNPILLPVGEINLKNKIKQGSSNIEKHSSHPSHPSRFLSFQLYLT